MAWWLVSLLNESTSDILRAVETFTPELAPTESPPLGVGYDYGADRIIAPAGLSPARPTAY